MSSRAFGCPVAWCFVIQSSGAKWPNVVRVRVATEHSRLFQGSEKPLAPSACNLVFCLVLWIASKSCRSDSSCPSYAYSKLCIQFMRPLLLHYRHFTLHRTLLNGVIRSYSSYTLAQRARETAVSSVDEYSRCSGAFDILVYWQQNKRGRACTKHLALNDFPPPGWTGLTYSCEGWNANDPSSNV